MSSEYIVLVARTEIEGVKFEAREAFHRDAVGLCRDDCEGYVRYKLGQAVARWLKHYDRVTITEEEPPL